ncbi:retrovirus-related pol polyprotein from transposon TNT 1-94 [Tanacetum coccineum]
MHNNIMADGSRDRPPMLAMGRYAQWQLHFLRYIDTRPNGDALSKCILQGSYTPFTITILAVPAIDNTPAVPERTAVETILNMSPKNKAHYESEKEAIHLLLTGIGDEIYLTFDACKTAHKMWIAIERLQQVSSTRMVKYQKEVNEIHVERIAKNANPLALVASAQPHPDPYYQALKSHKSYASQPKASPPTRSHATTRHKGKKTTKPITPPSESASEEDSDPEQAQRDKDMQKNLALIAKYFKKIYKPTNNNLRTSSNSRNKKFRYFFKVVQQTGMQCFNCKEFGHFAKECRKPKRVKDSTYYKENMLLCKQAEKGIPLQAEQSDWLADTDEEIDEQELEAHYSFMAKIQQHSKQTKSISNTCVVEKVDSNVIPDSPDMCDNDIQTDQNAEDERAALANLIANLKLDVDKNKKIQKQLNKANTSLAQELKEYKSIFMETSRTPGDVAIIEGGDHIVSSIGNKNGHGKDFHNKEKEKVVNEVFRNKDTQRQGMNRDESCSEGIKEPGEEISVEDNDA